MKNFRPASGFDARPRSILRGSVKRVSKIRSAGLLAVALLVPLATSAQPLEMHPRWIAAWAASPQLYGVTPPAAKLPPAPPAFLNHQTVRMRLTPNIGGDNVRVRFSNVFGTVPLHVASASVALSSDGAGVRADSAHVLRFKRNAYVTIAPGAEAWSDSIDLKVGTGQAISVSLYVDRVSPRATIYNLRGEAAWTASGNVAAKSVWNGAAAMPMGQIVTGVDVARDAPMPVVVTFGDSITVAYEGLLDARLHQDLGAGTELSVIKAGIAGNRLLNSWIGPKGTERFKRDVLAQSGVSHAVVLLGINDINYSMASERWQPTPGLPSVAQLGEGLAQLIAQANARGVKIIVGTLPPFKGAPFWNLEKESRRQALNAWIRARRDVAGIADFDAILRDPADPLRLKVAYDSGDHLHPSSAGAQAMVQVISLDESSRTAQR